MIAPRPGERLLAGDPAARSADATLVFVGTARTPWAPGDCPRNLRQAREAAARDAPDPAGRMRLEIAAPYRAGLEGLTAGDVLIVLYWMDGARRDLIRQAPRHRPDGAGVFALRSPARPNPVALAVVRCLDIDAAGGIVTVDALDCHDGTPVLDIKPWLPGVDIPPGG